MPRGQALRTASTSTACWPRTGRPRRGMKAGSSRSPSRTTSKRRRDRAAAQVLLAALILAGAAAASPAGAKSKRAPPPPPAPAAEVKPAAPVAPPESIAVELAAIARAEDRRDWADGTLRGALRHADAAVRGRAALAVGRLQDSTTVQDLLPLLSDPAPEVRREAIFALGQIQNALARAPLEQQLESPDTEARQLAI